MSFKTFIILSCIFSISFACKTIEGKANGVAQKLRSESPWQVLVQTYITYESSYMCSGALIHPQFVLTTANCVFGESFVNLHVYAWNLADEFEDEREIYRANQVIMHPGFDGLKHLHDIALVKFKNPLNVASKNYAIIPMAEVSETLNPGDSGMISGWGLLDFKTESASNIKHSQEVLVQNEANCDAAYGPFNGDNMGRVCIRRASGTNCVSDSGALFIKDGKLSGILSFGQREACENPGAMNGMQDIRPHREWIDSEIAK
jgi:secreted trypsin-like serine protease